jgi:hypothetical protein
MASPDDFLDKIHRIVSRYLDGTEPFETAARQLADHFRGLPAGAGDAPHVPDAPQRRISIKPVPLSDWMNPSTPPSSGIVAGSPELAPGRSERDEGRARELFIAALRLARGSAGDPA